MKIAQKHDFDIKIHEYPQKICSLKGEKGMNSMQEYTHKTFEKTRKCEQRLTKL